MKTITAHEHELITSAVGEGLTALSEGVIEKDLLITEVLRIAAAFDGEGVRLVFCGGTCLSKAHGLIERMSEDVDFKLIVPDGLSRSARSRLLSQFKWRLVAAFEQAGFLVPADQVVARDENSYMTLNLHYESRFASVASLRPEIKVELNARPPVLPVASQSIHAMLDVLTSSQQAGFLISCISIEETLAEKVLSFLRRTAETHAGRNRAAYDDRLVRHIYDVRAIAHARKDLPVELPHQHFAAMVLGDAVQYRNQYPEFEADPAGEMRNVLEALRNEPDAFERDYAQFVEELVFGEPVSFADARAVFVDVAERLLGQLPS